MAMRLRVQWPAPPPRRAERRPHPPGAAWALLAGLLATWAPLRGAAQPSPGLPSEPTYTVRAIERDDGLPDSQVNAIARTVDGHLWLGTRRGLVRYDGLTFTHWMDDLRQPVLRQWINALFVDRRGRLWIAGARGLAVREDTVVRVIPPDQLPAIETWRLVEDRRGRLWVATEDGLFVGDDRRFARVPGVEGYLYAVAEDRLGRIWYAGRDRLGWTDGVRAVPLLDSLGLRGRLFELLAEDPSHLWVGTQAGAVRIAIAADGAARIDRRVDTRLGTKEQAVWALARGPDARLWLGVEGGGVLVWDGRQLTAIDRADGDTWSLFIDPRGTVWAGTGTGLERIQRIAFATINEGLPPSAVWSVQVDGRGGLWVALGDGSVHRWNGRRFEERLRGDSTLLSSPILPSADGLLVAERSRRLVRITGDGRRTPEPPLGREIGDLLGIFDDGRGRLWISADSGLFVRERGRLTPMNAALGLPPDARPRAIAMDDAGRLLLGRPGLTVVDGAERRHYGAREGLTDAAVRALLPLRDVTWIGTADSGLFALHAGRITSLRTLHPALSREVLAIAEDGAGHLWLSGGYGLVRIPRRELEAVVRGAARQVEVRTFDQADGLPASGFRGDFMSRIARDAAGGLWFPNAAGVVRVAPDLVPDDRTPPRVLLEAVVVDGMPRAATGGLALPAGVGRVEFTFALTDALRPRAARVQFRLVGLDSSWRDAQLRRTVAFGPLPGGRYRFEVRAASAHGPWGSPLGVPMEVAPRLRERPWFLPGVAMLSGGVVLLLGRLRRRRLEAQRQELARQVAARTADLEAVRATLEQRVAERTAALAGELAERERLEQELVTARKLEGLGRLAGGVAHEVNNSMTSVLGFTDLAAAAASDRPDVLRELDEVRQAGERVAAITRQLLTFAHRQRAAFEPLALGGVVASLERTLRDALPATVSLRLDLAPTPRILGDRRQLEQLLLNLVLNARDAMPDGGTVDVRVAPARGTPAMTVGGTPLAGGDYATLTVGDTGHGMDAGVRERLFDPFFTTKAPDRGTGMGLAVCHGIVQQHGGAIGVDSAPGEGTRMTVWLPAAPAGADAASAAGPPDQAPADRGGDAPRDVLVVDDEPDVRAVIQRHLVGAGHAVRVAGGLDEALRLVDERRADLVITDILMPGGSGLDLARTLRARGDDVPILFITGYAGHDARVEQEVHAIGALLHKPFAARELLAAVRDALQGTAPGPASMD